MRRPKSPVRVIQRGDSPFLLAEFHVGGRRCRVSTGERDPATAYQRAVALWQEARAKAGEPAAPVAGQPLALLVARCIARAEQLGHHDRYASALEADLKHHVLPVWKSLEEITSSSWEAAWPALHEDRTWRSVARIGKHLRHLLRYAISVGALTNMPAIKTPPRAWMMREEKQRRALTEKEMEKLLRHFRARGLARTARIYEVLFWTGLRQGTVEKLRGEWLDGEELHIPPGILKNSERLTLPLLPRAAKALRQEAKGPGPIFGPFDCSTAFWGAVDRLGWKREGLVAHHVGRHSLATLVAGRGASSPEMQALFGWKTRAMADRYTHPTRADAARALGRLGGTIRAQSKRRK